MRVTDSETRAEAVTGIKTLTYILSDTEVSRYLELDVDVTIIDLLRYKDISKDLKHCYLSILANISAAQDFSNLAKVICAYLERFCDQKFIEFIIYDLENEKHSEILTDDLLILQNLMLEPCTPQELMRIVSQKLICLLLELGLNSPIQVLCCDQSVRNKCIQNLNIILTGLDTKAQYSMLQEFGPEMIRATIYGLNRTMEDHTENLTRLHHLHKMLELEEMFQNMHNERCDLVIVQSCLNSELIEKLESMQHCTGKDGYVVTTKAQQIFTRFFDLY